MDQDRLGGADPIFIAEHRNGPTRTVTVAH
jgi:replicative DNA helicase